MRALAGLLVGVWSVVCSSPALADSASYQWDISVAGKSVGKRTLDVSDGGGSGQSLRVLSMRTTLKGSVVGVALDVVQRLDAIVNEGPASFHAIVRESGSNADIQAQYSSRGWTVTTVDASGPHTSHIDATRVQLSTVDLFDPDTSLPISRFDNLSLLIAETGEIWSGRVERLGHAQITVGGKSVGIDGWSWTSPEGRHEFWYDTEGLLVKYQTRVMGINVQGVLASVPPPGPDDFAVRIARVEVSAADL